MKILIDARMYGLEHSGIGRYLIHLIDELQRLDDKNKYFLLFRRKYFNTVKFKTSSFNKILADYKHYSFIEQLRLPRLIKGLKPDVAHFPHFNVPFFWNGKFIVTIHDMTMHKQGVNATNMSFSTYYLKRIPYKLIFRKAVKRSVKIITPTKNVKEEISINFKISEDKIVSIPEGVNLNYSEASGDKKISERYKLQGRYFIYTGNVYPHKNLRRAIEAISLINKRLKKRVVLVIVGSRDAFLKRLEGYTAELEAKSYVKTLGFVPDGELANLYRNSVGFIYPSLSEGFGLQGLEAMTAGTLVLASDIPTFREVYKKNVLYFNPYDFSSIAKVMKEALEMEEKGRERIIKKAKRFVKRYSWNKMARETLKVYGEFLPI